MNPSALPDDRGDESEPIRRSEREAFVLAAYAGLYRWFCHLSASADHAADLTQETFTAFWRLADRRRPDVSPTTWLYAIGRNQWRKQRRDRKDHKPVPMDDLASRGGSPEQGAQDREFREAVELAVSELPDDLREAFTLRFWQGFSYEQIGVVQGVSSGLARWRYFAARRRLHRSLVAWAPERQQCPEDSHARSRES